MEPCSTHYMFCKTDVHSIQYALCCDSGWSYRLLHIAIGATTLAMVVGVVMTTERELLLFLVNRLPNRIQRLLHRLGVITTKIE